MSNSEKNLVAEENQIGGPLEENEEQPAAPQTSSKRSIEEERQAFETSLHGPTDAPVASTLFDQWAVNMTELEPSKTLETAISLLAAQSPEGRKQMSDL